MRLSHTCAALAVLAAATAAAIAQPCTAWIPPEYPVVSDHAVAYDSNRNVVVLFGGSTNGLARRETWEWNGINWTLRSTSGPPPRAGHAMAFDAARGECVLFVGGTTPVTWTWNGTVWTPRSSAHRPAATSRYAMAYDNARQRTVLFGGTVSPGYSNQTWEWDGQDWTLRPIFGPPASIDHAMVYVPTLGGVLLCGGSGSTTWLWNGTTWTGLFSEGLPRPDLALGYDATRDVVVMYHDRSVRELTSTGWVTRTAQGPTATTGATFAFDAARNQFLLVGGLGGAEDTWVWTGSAWTLRHTASPFPRRSHHMVYDEARRQLVTFGGTNGGPTFLRDTWIEMPDGWRQVSNTGPSPRYGYGMVYDSWRARVVLFGGLTGTPASPTISNETWEWDGERWSLRTSPATPSARSHPAMAFDSVRGVTVLFGGNTDPQYSALDGQTWEWDGETWTLRTTTGPAPRASSAMAFDPERGVSVLHSGRVNSQFVIAETWEWDGSEWSLRVSDGGLYRYGHRLAYDPTRHGIVMFGGQYGYPLGPWLYDGVAWSLIVPPGPESDLQGVAMAFSGQLNRIAIHGGLYHTQYTLRDIRILDERPHIQAHPLPLTVTENQPARFEVMVMDYVACQWRHNGVPLVNDARITGADTPALTILQAVPHDSGLYEVQLTASSTCVAVSTAAPLIVRCRVDTDLNGDINPADVSLFVTTWFTSLNAGALTGDFDANGLVQPADVSAFIAAWFTTLTAGGC